MTIKLLGIYESKINGMDVTLYRDEETNDYDRGRLVIDGSFKGLVPFYYTVQKMMQLEEVFIRGDITTWSRRGRGEKRKTAFHREG